MLAIRWYAQLAFAGLTLPLVTTAGGIKFGKSLGNVWRLRSFFSPFFFLRGFFLYYLLTRHSEVKLAVVVGLACTSSVSLPLDVSLSSSPLHSPPLRSQRQRLIKRAQMLKTVLIAIAPPTLTHRLAS